MIHKFLELAHETWPTDKARHNITLSQASECLELAIFHAGQWFAFTVTEDEFADPAGLVKGLNAFIENKGKLS